MSEKGRIICSIGGLYTVASADGFTDCRARGIFRKEGISPCVGDYVFFSKEGAIEKILPRKNFIPRPPTANLDAIFFVVSTTEPAPNLMLLDSFLAVSIYLEIPPVLLLTKLDLKDGSGLLELYTNAGIPTLEVQYEKPETIEAVAALLKGKTAMMTGNSGVGKSTLLNAMDPKLQLPVGEVSRKLGRGRHTTRKVELYPCADGFLADTPGFSTFEAEQYVRMDPRRIAWCYPEFRPYLGKCFFQDCAHVKEKGCAVLAALENGKIAKSRHESYCSLYENARKRKAWEM